MIYLILLLYLVGAVLSYGLTFAYFEREYPELTDEDYSKTRGLAFFFGLASWLGVAVALYKGDWGKHGLKYRK